MSPEEYVYQVDENIAKEKTTPWLEKEWKTFRKKLIETKNKM